MKIETQIIITKIGHFICVCGGIAFILLGYIFFFLENAIYSKFYLDYSLYLIIFALLFYIINILLTLVLIKKVEVET